MERAVPFTIGALVGMAITGGAMWAVLAWAIRTVAREHAL
jgi:hypothetical protein